MSKSTTPNVFITTSREVIEDFLNISVNKVKTKKFLDTLKEEDKRKSIIAGPEINSNLIELEHTNGMGGEGHYIRLRLVENGQSFESQFIRTDVYPELVNNAVKESQKLNGSFLELETQLKNKSLDPAKYAYFCYGIGEFVDDWAGPIVMQFIKGEIAINDNGVKEIVLEFRGEVGKLLRNEIESVSVDKTYSLLNKYEHFYSNKIVRYNIRVDVDIDQSKKFEAVTSNTINEKIKLLFKRYILGLINDYSDPKIQAAEKTIAAANAVGIFMGPEAREIILEKTDIDDNLNVNVITLIPRIDSITQDLTQKTIDENTLYTVKDFNRNLVSGLPLDEFRSIERDQYLSNRAAAERSAGRKEAAKITEDQIRKSIVKADLKNWDNTVYKRPDADDIIKRLDSSLIIKKLGLNATIVDEKVSTQQRLTNNSPSRNKDLTDETISEAKNKSSKLIISLALDPNQKDTLAEVTPDFYAPIQKFNESFKLLCFDKHRIDYDPVLIVENDVRVLKIWKKFGFIKDATKPAFIYGHQGFISDLLYLENSFDIRSAEKINISVDKLMPSDKNLYTSTDYRLSYYYTFKKKRKNSSFGENTSRNDELAVSEVAIDLANSLDIPIFRHNMANPNVISVSLQNNLVYKQVMDFGFKNQSLAKMIDFGLVTAPKDIDEDLTIVANRQKEIIRIAPEGTLNTGASPNAPWWRYLSPLFWFIPRTEAETAAVTYSVDVTSTRTSVKEVKQQILDYIEQDKTRSPEQRADMSENSDRYGYASIFNNFQFKTLEEKFETINLFLTKYTSQFEQDGQYVNKDINLEALSFSLVTKLEGVTPQVFMQTKNEEQKTSFQTQLYNQLASLVFQVNIKTLPFFGIQAPLTNVQCFFIGLQNMIGSMKKTSSIYNGVYYIIGFRHLISTKEVFSEFQLSKKPETKGRD
jgi:hypothetical protein